MHLLLRADSDASIGAGHVMRSLALARRWMAAGGSATFIGHIASDRIRERVSEAGVTLRPLNPVLDQAQDLRETLAALEALRGGMQPWAVVDGYAFGPGYHAAIRQRGFPLLVIDDLANLPGYHADIVLNQNLGAEELPYRADTDTRRLLGARFALLQPEFDRWRDRDAPTAPVARRILVTAGGADPHGATARILDALDRVDIEGLDITVVAGPASGGVQSPNPGRRHAVQVVSDVRDMATLMATMDLAVTGGGSTCWELAFLGLPAIILELSENQQRSSRALAAAGAVENAGPVQAIEPSALAARITELCMDADLRRAMGSAGRRLVDGKGGARVIGRLGLGLPPLTLRLATRDDARPLWTLAADPSVREQSFNTSAIPWETHAAWFDIMLASPVARMWVMVSDTGLAGQVRYEARGDEAEIGISVGPAFRGYGLAARLLASTWADSCRQLGVARARGVVFTSNRSSAAAFREAGFIEEAGVEMIRGHECHVFTRTLQS